jgi:DNA-binding IclR family transcriptional regulator
MPQHYESTESTFGMTVLRIIDLLHAVAGEEYLFRLTDIATDTEISKAAASRYLSVFCVKGVVEKVSLEGHADAYRTIFKKRVLPTPQTWTNGLGKRVALVLDILQFVADTRGQTFRNKDLCDTVGIVPPVATRYLQIIQQAGVIRYYGKAQYIINYTKANPEGLTA